MLMVKRKIQVVHKRTPSEKVCPPAGPPGHLLGVKIVPSFLRPGSNTHRDILASLSAERCTCTPAPNHLCTSSFLTNRVWRPSHKSCLRTPPSPSRRSHKRKHPVPRQTRQVPRESLCCVTLIGQQRWRILLDSRRSPGGSAAGPAAGGEPTWPQPDGSLVGR